MADDGAVWFPSKIDWWLGAMLCIPPISAAVVLVGALMHGQLFYAFVPLAVTVAIFGGLVFPMRYGISDTELIVRFGLVTQRVQLAKINSVVPTNNPLSAPALSLDRLEIRWGQGIFEATMISPADRERFLDLVAEKAGLSRDGDELQRRD